MLKGSFEIDSVHSDRLSLTSIHFSQVTGVASTDGGESDFSAVPGFNATETFLVAPEIDVQLV